MADLSSLPDEILLTIYGYLADAAINSSPPLSLPEALARVVKFIHADNPDPPFKSFSGSRLPIPDRRSLYYEWRCTVEEPLPEFLSRSATPGKSSPFSLPQYLTTAVDRRTSRIAGDALFAAYTARQPHFVLHLEQRWRPLEEPDFLDDYDDLDWMLDLTSQLQLLGQALRDPELVAARVQKLRLEICPVVRYGYEEEDLYLTDAAIDFAATEIRGFLRAARRVRELEVCLRLVGTRRGFYGFYLLRNVVLALRVRKVVEEEIKGRECKVTWVETDEEVSRW